MVTKIYKESIREFYSENEILKMNHTLKPNAKPKSLRLTKDGYVYLYDFLDSVSLLEKKTRNTKHTCSECGVRSSDEFFFISKKPYCSKCNDIFKRNKNTYIEKYLFNKKVSFFLEKIHLNKEFSRFLDINEGNLNALQGDIRFSVVRDSFKNKPEIRVTLNGSVIGFFPKQIIIKKYKSLPSFSFSSDKICKLLEKGALKLEGEISLFKTKTSFQGKKSHKIALTINSL